MGSAPKYEKKADCFLPDFYDLFSVAGSAPAIHPCGNLLKPAHAVGRLADPAQAVAFPVEQAHPGFNAVMHQRVVHLHALLKQTAVILKRMDEQRRRLGLIRKLQRRLVPDLLHVAPWVSAHLIVVKGKTDVGVAD